MGGISAEHNTTSTPGRSAFFYYTLDLYSKFLITVQVPYVVEEA